MELKTKPEPEEYDTHGAVLRLQETWGVDKNVAGGGMVAEYSVIIKHHLPKKDDINDIRGDIKDSKNEFKNGFKDVENEFKDVRNEFKNDLKDVRNEINALDVRFTNEFEKLRVERKADHKNFMAAIKRLEVDAKKSWAAIEELRTAIEELKTNAEKARADAEKASKQQIQWIVGMAIALATVMITAMAFLN